MIPHLQIAGGIGDDVSRMVLQFHVQNLRFFLEYGSTNFNLVFVMMYGSTVPCPEFIIPCLVHGSMIPHQQMHMGSIMLHGSTVPCSEYSMVLSFTIPCLV